MFLRVRPLLFALLTCCAVAAPAAAQTYTVGEGAQTPAITSSFIAAYDRGQFSILVKAPNGTVRTLSSPVLVQEFSAASGTGTLALVDPDPNGANVTYQMYADLYGYFSKVGISSTGTLTYGYPTNDTTACPAVPIGTCDYQLFSGNAAMFVYSTSAGYTVADPFYTEWSTNGGIGGALGPANSAATSVTSVANTAGTQQLFAGGAIYSYTVASATTASTYTVSGSIYQAYYSAGGYALAGFPTSEQTLLASGVYQQTFEKARITWTPGSTASVVFPLATILILGSQQGLSLNLGATATLTADTYDVRGNQVTGRTLTWSTTNGNAVTVQGNGNTATIKAVGAGVANIYVTGEGITSSPFPVSVNAPCCEVGQGAPTPAITQAFQTAVTRDHLSLALPAPGPVTRTGNGYIQTFTASGSSGTVYVIAEADNSSVAYVISGALYTAYLANGGFTGALGYPASDASAGGTQSFTSGAVLAGSPVVLVPVPVAAKWLSLGAETGLLGAAVSTAKTFVALTGTQGAAQTFANGVIYGLSSGAHAGQAFYSTGLILARYLALSGVSGTLGAPAGDPTVNSAGVQTQNFETGYIDLQPGAASAVEHYNPRTPAVSVSPSTAVPGGRIQISLTGFSFGATLSVSITGQPNFTVQVPGGQFTWTAVIPSGAKAATVAIQAKDTGSSDQASGSYSITSLPQLQPTLTVVSGNQQSGVPGSLLAVPLVAVLRDINGNPLSNIPVAYTVSPGASVQAPAVTDANGLISARLRLPSSGGVALLAVSSAGLEVSFSALATANTVQGVPAYTQTTPQGSRIAALAALVRYYQNAGSLGAPNGFATAAGLAQYLSSNNGTALSDTGAAIANPWAATQFAGLAGGISVQTASVNSILDLLNTGSPLVVEMVLNVDGAAAGSTTVNAIGVNADGSIAILDPNSSYGRASLSDYLNGFNTGAHEVLGTISAVIQIVPTLGTPSGFVVASPIAANASASSAAAVCPSIDLTDPANAGQPAPAHVGGVRFIACDGTSPPYQVSFANQTGATIYDLAGGAPVSIPASGAVAYQVTRNGTALAVTPQTVSISSVVNPAGYGPGLSPGGIFTIFGSGLSAGQGNVTAGSQAVTILAAYPFQINAIMPAAIAPGQVTIQVGGALGSASQQVNVTATAPGIFVIGTTAEGNPQGAILNQDGSVNNDGTPVLRGQYISIYGTGLGATVAQQGLQWAASSVQVVLDGTLLSPSFAGLTPGVPGLYQVNVQIPTGTPPGTQHTLAIQAAGQASNAVALAVE